MDVVTTYEREGMLYAVLSNGSIYFLGETVDPPEWAPYAPPLKRASWPEEGNGR